MSTVTPRARLRWSTARDCPRQAVYQAQDAPAKERTDAEERLLFSGRELGDMYGRWLGHRHELPVVKWKDWDGTTDAVVREVEIPWEFGLGHADIWLPNTSSLVEVLSTSHATEHIRQSKLVQLVGYMEAFPQAAAGALVILEPRWFTDDTLIVVRNTAAYESLAEQVQSRIAQLQAWADHGTLPERVCAKPSDARSHWCRHADFCFQGWEPPPMEERHDLEPAAARLAIAKDRERAAKRGLDEITALRKEAEAELADLPVGETRAGSYKVVRTHVARRPTLDLTKAELAGALNVEALAEFMRPGAEYSTWRVDRLSVSAEDDGVDYGEVPF